MHKDDVKDLVRIFEKGLKKYPDFKIDMLRFNFYVNDLYQCGCHAGFYQASEGSFKNYSDFYYGGDDLARKLGFFNRFNLQEWARTHPEIWGNTQGQFLFSSSVSFGKHLENIFPAKVILDHWKGVLFRLEKVNI